MYFCVMTVMILFLFFSLTLIGLKNNCLISFVFDGNIKIQDGRDLHDRKKFVSVQMMKPDLSDIHEKIIIIWNFAVAS